MDSKEIGWMGNCNGGGVEWVVEASRTFDQVVSLTRLLCCSLNDVFTKLIRVVLGNTVFSFFSLSTFLDPKITELSF